MTETVGEAFVAIRPDAKRFETETHAAVTSGVRTAAGAAAGILAGVGVASFLSGVNDEARESQKVGAQTAAVLKSTAGAANIQQDAVESLAGSLSKKAGVDDEVIQSGENMLLTFKNIRNEAGKGNDIFNQTTTAALDMAAGMAAASGGEVDLKGASIQLGKALNDPVKGITALTRVGVTFTQQQKDQIAAMVESGNTLGAQKIILKEVMGEFGGSAAANATDADKAKVAIANLKETIGTLLLPVIDQGAQAVSFLADGFSSLPGPVQEAITYLAVAGGALVVVAKGVELFGGVQSVFSGMAAGIKTFGGAASEAISGTISLMYGLTTAEAAAAVGAFLLEAAIGAAAGAAAFILTTKLLEWIFGVDEGGQQATASMGDLAAAIDKVGKPSGTLVGQFHDVEKTLRDTEIHVHLTDIAIAAGAFQKIAEKNVDVAARLAQQFPKTSEKYAIFKNILKNVTIEHNAAADAADHQGEALQSVTGQIDKTTDGFKHAKDVFGDWGASGIAAAGATSDALDATATKADNFAKALEGGISSFTDAFAHNFDTPFGFVDQQQFEDFFTGSIADAATWATELKDLINRGVDEGIVQEIAQAGPKSKPELDAFVNEVDTHGVEWVNSVFHSGDAATAETEAALNRQVVLAAFHGAEYAALMAAYQDEVTGHGTAKLEELLHSSDKNLAAMAYGAILKLGGVHKVVDDLPDTWNLTAHVYDQELDTFLAKLRTAGIRTGLPFGGGGSGSDLSGLAFLNDPNTFAFLGSQYGDPSAQLGYSSGGWVGGRGNGDTVPAMLTPGEYVMSRDEVAAAQTAPTGGPTFQFTVQGDIANPTQWMRAAMTAAHEETIVGSWS